MDNLNLIEIKNLNIGFHNQGKPIDVVNSISFNIPKGKTIAIVGESGSGKSVTAMSILKLLPYPSAYHKTGEIIFKNKNLLSIDDKSMQKIRGKNITAIFQEPMTSLNPLHTIEKQINEILMLHSSLSFSEATIKTTDLLKEVGLKDISRRIKSFPHELSGGERQRVMIAMSIANKPELLIADEPTTALDVTIQMQIINLLKSIQESRKMSILFISHDLSLVKKIADYICIMKNGLLIEQNTKNEIFSNPQNNYTKELIYSKAKKKEFVKQTTKKVLEVNNLKVWYPIKKGILKKTTDYVKAVDNISFNLEEKKTLGIVGESGSGKTSLIMALLKLIKSKGDIEFNGTNLNKISQKNLRLLRKEIQVVFQDPFSSLSPRMTVEQIISEGLEVHKKEITYKKRIEKIREVLKTVGLNFEEVGNRYPHEFSGGQRQRISIARALILMPKLMILDEPTSALDVSIQTQILDLLNNLQEKYNFCYIFISHDIKVIKAVSDNIIVMKNGIIVEKGNAEILFNNPQKMYTKELIQAVI